MKMSARPVALASAATLLAAAALPAHGDTFTQWAPVIRATPVYNHVSDPRQQCWTERVTANEYIDRRGVPLGAVAGGITGGGLSDQGSVVALGDAIDRERAGIEVAPVTREVERCRTVDVGQDVLQGYDVTYRYQNRDFATRMPYDPGERVQVQVDVTPNVQ